MIDLEKKNRACGEDVKTLDFQLTNLNKGKGSQGLNPRAGLFSFKEQFGGETSPYVSFLSPDQPSISYFIF